jgi:hypothetical protein
MSARPRVTILPPSSSMAHNNAKDLWANHPLIRAKLELFVYRYSPLLEKAQ